jgi:RHS repeat-associated protein
MRFLLRYGAIFEGFMINNCIRIFLSAFLFTSGLVSASDPTDGYIAEFAIVEEGKQGEGVEGELIDLRTGSLSWEVPLMDVPGQGGLGIELYLSQNKVKNKLDGGTYQQAANWQLEIPRIQITGAPVEYSSNPCEEPYWFYSVGGSDGTVRPYFHGSGVNLLIPGEAPKRLLLRSSSNFPTRYDYVSQDNWVAECTADGNGFIVFSPNGRKYKLDIVATEGLTQWAGQYAPVINAPEFVFYASSVEDRFGNWVRYVYANNSYSFRFYEDQVGDTQVTQKYLIKVEASDGRMIDFLYYRPEVSSFKTAKLRSLIYDGVDVLFSYDEYERLQSIRMPNNGNESPRYYKFFYKTSNPLTPYHREDLGKVVTPSGVEIEYKYAEKPEDQFVLVPSSNGVLKASVISSRAISGTVAPTVKNYSYIIMNDGNVTRVRGKRNRNYFFSRDRYTFGSLVREETLDKYFSVSRGIDYVWDFAERLGYSQLGIAQESKDGIEHRVRLRSKIIDGKYLTNYTSYDPLGYPTEVVESGQQSRTTRYEYLSSHLTNSGMWVVGNLDKKNIVDYGTPYNLHIGYTDNLMPSRYYDGVKNITSVLNYDELGNIKEQIVGLTNESQRITTYSDFDLGYPQKITQPDGVVIDKRYDSFGRVVSESDGMGNVTKYSFYSGNENYLKSLVPPEGDEIVVSWDFRFNTKSVSRGGFKKVQDFDGWGNLTKESVYLGVNVLRKIITYDELGRISFASKIERLGAVSNPFQHGLQYFYDELDRPTKVVNTSDSSESNFYYNDDWNSIAPEGSPLVENGWAEINANGGLKVIDNISFNNPDEQYVSEISIRNNSSEWISTEISRNATGDITSVVQGAHQQEFNYSSDHPGLLSGYSSSELGYEIKYIYDEFGEKYEEHWVGSTGRSQNIKKYKYDQMGRITYVNHAARDPYAQGWSNSTYTYYPNGELATVSNDVTRWVYVYNGNRQLLSETLSLIDPLKSQVLWAANIAYQYNGLGHRSSVTYPGGETVFLYPDVLGRPTQVGGYVTDISYHPNGIPRFFVYQGGIETSTELDDRDFVRRIYTDAPSTNYLKINPLASVDRGRFLDIEYEYDYLGNVTQIKNTNYDRGGFLYGEASRVYSSSVMKYDGLSRLVEVEKRSNVNGAWSRKFYGYSYDVNGNIVNKTEGGRSHQFFYNSKNQLISGVDGRRYLYSNSGNVIYNGEYSFTNDKLGKPIFIKSSNNAINYAYDSHGHRLVAKVNDDLPVYNIYTRDGSLLQTIDLNSLKVVNSFYLDDKNVATREFLISEDSAKSLLSSLPHLIPSLSDVLDVDKLNLIVSDVKEEVSDRVTYYYNDILGSPVAASSSLSGVLDADSLWYEEYSPYGERLTGSKSRKPNNIWYAGKAEDLETGLLYMGARFYDPEIGRFYSPDPIRFFDSNAMSFNRYLYVNNNPYKYSDPTGEILSNIVGGIVAGIQGSVVQGAEIAIGARDSFSVRQLAGDISLGAISSGLSSLKSAAQIGAVVKRIDKGAGASRVTKGIGPKAGSAGGEGAKKAFSNKVKDQARKESNDTCVFCGTKTTREPGPTRSEIDHAIPKSRGGNNTIENAQNTCRTCNRSKGAKTTDEFLN